MNKLNTYREIIQNLLKDYIHNDYSREHVDRELIFDRERDHYQIVNVGWENNHRIYGCIIHFDIKNEKI